MKVNTTVIETDVLLSLARANERQACEIRQLEEKVVKVKELIEGMADYCIVQNRLFEYADIPIRKLCQVIGMDWEELDRYVETAKKSKLDSSAI